MHPVAWFSTLALVALATGLLAYIGLKPLLPSVSALRPAPAATAPMVSIEPREQPTLEPQAQRTEPQTSGTTTPHAQLDSAVSGALDQAGQKETGGASPTQRASSHLAAVSAEPVAITSSAPPDARELNAVLRQAIAEPLAAMRGVLDKRNVVYWDYADEAFLEVDFVYHLRDMEGAQLAALWRAMLPVLTREDIRPYIANIALEDYGVADGAASTAAMRASLGRVHAVRNALLEHTAASEHVAWLQRVLLPLTATPKPGAPPSNHLIMRVVLR